MNLRALPFATALFLASCLPLAAEVTPRDTVITSSTVEMWSNDDETRAIFNGDVVVVGTNLRITCDRLEITATRIGDVTATVGKLDKFKHLLASGKVRIIQGEREASCGRAEVFPREEKIVLTEDPVVIDRGAEVIVTGEPLELLRGERRVRGKNPKFTFGPLKDLGFDKNTPAPKPDAAPAETPAPAAEGATK
jgi:lipopolysaccharide export system protein LptA